MVELQQRTLRKMTTFYIKLHRDDGKNLSFLFSSIFFFYASSVFPSRRKQYNFFSVLGCSLARASFSSFYRRASIPRNTLRVYQAHALFSFTFFFLTKRAGSARCSVGFCWVISFSKNQLFEFFSGLRYTLFSAHGSLSFDSCMGKNFNFSRTEALDVLIRQKC